MADVFDMVSTERRGDVFDIAGAQNSSEELSLRQGTTPTFWDGVMSLFRDPQKEAARSVKAIVDAEALNIGFSTAYEWSDAIDKLAALDPEQGQKRKQYLDAIKKFNETRVEDGWIKSLLNTARSVPVRMQIAAGGLLRMLEENVLMAPDLFMAWTAEQGGASDAEIRDIIKEAGRKLEEKNIRTIGESVVVAGKKKLQPITPLVEPGSAKYYVNEWTGSIINALAFLAPSLLTKNPSFVLTGMGLQSAGEAYAEQREAGMDVRTATLASLGYGTSEALTEFIPAGKYLKPGKQFVTRMIETQFSEIPTEVVNTIAQTVIDKVTIAPDTTFRDAVDKVVHTIYVTVGSTVGLSATSQGANKAIAKLLSPTAKNTFNKAATAELDRGATPAQAVNAGMGAVNSTPGGRAEIERHVTRMAEDFSSPVTTNETAQGQEAGRLGIRRYSDGDSVGRISEQTAEEINKLGFSTDASDVKITQKTIDHIDERRGETLTPEDIDYLRKTIEEPTEVLPNIGKDQAEYRTKSVLMIRRNGKNYLSIVEVLPGEKENVLWNFWKGSIKDADRYLKKFREEKARILESGGRRLPHFPPDQTVGGKPESLSGSQTQETGTDNTIPLYPEKVNEGQREGQKNTTANIEVVDGVRVIKVEHFSNVDKGVKVVERLPVLKAEDLFDAQTTNIKNALEAGREYYEGLKSQSLPSPAFSGESVTFTERGYDHLTGKHQRAITNENILRRLRLLPKVKQIIETTPFVDEIRDRKHDDAREYGLLGRFADGTVVRVVVEEIEREGKTFLSVYDWKDVSKKMKRVSPPDSSSDASGHGVGGAPSENITINVSEKGQNVKPFLHREGQENTTASINNKTPQEGRQAAETTRKSRTFVLSPEGSIDFGVVPDEISAASNGRFPGAPIRVEEGAPDDFGRSHIGKERIAEFKSLGYRDELDMLHDVAQHFTSIYEQPNGRLLLVKKNGKNKYAVVELQKEAENYYGVTTLFVEKKQRHGKPYEERSGRKLILDVARPEGTLQ